MAADKAPAIHPSESRAESRAGFSAGPGAEDFYDDWGLSDRWGERIITAVAAALGICVVAAVALLMGMV